ncbi:hypothetical protein MRY87_11605 [bacterium]|nr:hypothetical protein [bacterium]
MYSRFPKYKTVGEKKADAERKLRQLQKKDPDISPVRIEGKKIANSWWAEAWNGNLESYSDYDNRLARGKSYARHGFILDLKIDAGTISALVMGSGRSPYKVHIEIATLKKSVWNAITTRAQHELGGIAELLRGDFPESLSELFTEKKKGLFPSPKEISLDCSCPDWAEMCKHVAATLYGVGARLDTEPELFFTLRGVNLEELASSALKAEKASLIAKASAAESDRILEASDSDLSSLFQIDFSETINTSRKKASKKRKGRKR